MEKIKLSVIVPVFNSEMYLPQCLDSLLVTQGIENVEIILVDDGSIDNSGVIVDRYSTEHQNIKAIHKNNGGAADARNVGLQMASGKYVSFCDSDDLVNPELFAKVILETAKSDADIILWDGDLINEKGEKLKRKDRDYYVYKNLNAGTEITGRALLRIQIKACGHYPVTICLGAYRRQMLLDNNLFFRKGTVHEDDLWVPKVFLTAEGVVHIPERVYLYRIHESSVTNPESEDYSRHIAAITSIYPELYGLYEEVLKADPLKKLMDGDLTQRYLHWIYKYDFYRYGYGDKIDKKRLWKTSRRLRDKIRVLMLYAK